MPVPWSTVEVKPQVCSGKPVIKRTRIMVRNILAMAGGGHSIDRILESYAELKGEEVTAALEYATRVADEEEVILR